MKYNFIIFLFFVLPKLQCANRTWLFAEVLYQQRRQGYNYLLSIFHVHWIQLNLISRNLNLIQHHILNIIFI